MPDLILSIIKIVAATEGIIYIIFNIVIFILGSLLLLGATVAFIQILNKKIKTRDFTFDSLLLTMLFGGVLLFLFLFIPYYFFLLIKIFLIIFVFWLTFENIEEKFFLLLKSHENRMCSDAIAIIISLILFLVIMTCYLE
jgi:hypothetical protein